MSLPQIPDIFEGFSARFCSFNEPAADPRYLRGVEREVLLLHHFYAYRRELVEPVAAAAGPPAWADAADYLRLVAHADLAQLDARLELAREVADVGAEVDALVGRKVEEELALRAQELDVDELHVEVVRLQQPLRADEDRLLLLAVFGLSVAVLLRGEVHEGQVRDDGLRVFHHAVAVLRRVLQQAVFGLLLRAHLADDERELLAARGLDDELFTFFYIPVVLDEAEITRLTIDRQVFSHKERPP